MKAKKNHMNFVTYLETSSTKDNGERVIGNASVLLIDSLPASFAWPAIT